MTKIDTTEFIKHDTPITKVYNDSDHYHYKEYNTIRDFDYIEYVAKKAGTILIGKNVLFGVSSGDGIPYFDFRNYKLSKPNQDLLKRLNNNNPWFDENMKKWGISDDVKIEEQKKEVFGLEYDQNLTVGDVIKMYTLMAEQFHKQPLEYLQKKLSVRNIKFKLQYGFFQDIAVNNIFDANSGIIFDNNLAYRSYLNGKSKEQRKKELQFQNDVEEEDKKTPGFKNLLKRIEEITKNKDVWFGNNFYQAEHSLKSLINNAMTSFYEIQNSEVNEIKLIQ